MEVIFDTWWDKLSMLQKAEVACTNLNRIQMERFMKDYLEGKYNNCTVKPLIVMVFEETLPQAVTIP